MIEGYNFLSANVNSLNTSERNCFKNVGSKFNTKIAPLIATKAEFIILVDTRIGKFGKELNLFLRTNSLCRYNMIINSSRNSRGVAILIRADLDLDFEVIFYDVHENSLIIKVVNEKSPHLSFLVGGLYGPPQNHSPNFINEIFNQISPHGLDFICMGDLNTVTDPSPPSSNIDLLGHRAIPNIKHCKALNLLIEENVICDPFRLLNPDLKKYSYQPFQGKNSSMSRLDHVLTNPDLVRKIDCVEMILKPNRLFDHLPLLVKFKRKSSVYIEKKINSQLLNIPGCLLVGFIASYGVINDNLKEKIPIIDDVIRSANAKLSNIRYILTMKAQNDFFKQDALLSHLLDKLIANAMESFSALPSFEQLSNHEFEVSHDFLLQSMTNSIVREVATFQSFFLKLSRKREHYIRKKLLKAPTGTLPDLEAELNSINVKKNISYLRKQREFDILCKEKIKPSYVSIIKNSKKMCLYGW